MSVIRGYVTVQEAADILGVSTQRVLIFLQENRMDKVFTQGYLIPRKEINRFKKIPRLVGKPSNESKRKREAAKKGH